MPSCQSLNTHKTFKAVILLACILLSVVLAEEESRLTGAVVDLTDEGFPNRAIRLNDLRFRSYGYTTTEDTNGDGKKQLSWHLKEPHKFKTIVTVNCRDGKNDKYPKTWNDASIWVGADKTYLSTALTECIFDLNDSFLLTLPTICQQIESGVITFRRQALFPGLGASTWFGLYMSEMCVYQCGPLTDVPGLTVTYSVEHTSATETN